MYGKVNLRDDDEETTSSNTSVKQNRKGTSGKKLDQGIHIHYSYLKHSVLHKGQCEGCDEEPYQKKTTYQKYRS